MGSSAINISVEQKLAMKSRDVMLSENDSHETHENDFHLGKPVAFTAAVGRLVPRKSMRLNIKVRRRSRVVVGNRYSTLVLKITG